MASVVGDNLSREELLKLVQTLLERIAVLEAELDATRRELAAARKNSSNSSKPPSGDITRPPSGTGASGPKKRKRKIGGQPNHPKHERPPFPPDQVDAVRNHRLSRCPDCGGGLSRAKAAPKVHQQIELVKKPIRVTEHRGHAYWCKHCQRVHFAPLPAFAAATGLLGPRLRAFVVYLKSACHASFSTIRTFLKDVLGLTVSRGYLAKVLRKVSGALKQPYDELRQRLRCEKAVNADETGHKENGRRPWTWCFRAKDFTLYRIADSRGADILFDTLGTNFRGVLGCDYFSAYRRYLHEVGPPMQFCMAHLIRDVKFLTTLTDRPTRNYGTRLLDALQGLFHVFHRRTKMSERHWVWRLTDQRERILHIADTRVPPTREARNLAERFRRHGDAYFEFILSPRIDPTNNRAEQAMRFVVIDRRITQGTRGQAGRHWCERAWTVLATCAQQGRSAFNYFLQAIQNHLTGRPVPSLA